MDARVKPTHDAEFVKRFNYARTCAWVLRYFFAYDTPMPARTSLWIPYGAIG